MPEITTTGKQTEPRAARELPRVLKLVLVLVVTLLVVGAAIIWGIGARLKTAAAVKQETQDLAMPTVAVAHPKMGDLQNEVVLPGNIQAFIDSPIFARASGYLKKWNADIGARDRLASLRDPDLVRLT